jgi:putative colanic acid biosysnthesis UDP-glucose lipid carrier transferase
MAIDYLDFPSKESNRVNSEKLTPYDVIKRLIDVCFSLVTLLLLSPLFIVVALLIKFSSHGPVFFAQTRNGQAGKTFNIYKFRSMAHKEDADFEQCMPGDSRVTAIGHFLRRTSIDELPQLINVLRGDMSIVGPRPHAVDHDVMLAEQMPNIMQRYNVKPGITGLAQVYGLRGPTPTTDLVQKRLEADLEYAHKSSILFDLMIIFKTIPVVLARNNAH